MNFYMHDLHFGSISPLADKRNMSMKVKVSGPFVETSCVFQCIKNIINAEIWP